MTNNKNESKATGGGPNKMHAFSPCEEAVVNLLCLDKAINHNGTAFGLPMTSSPQHTPDIMEIEIDNVENTPQPGTSKQCSTPRSIPKKRKVIDTSELLSQQTEYLKQLTANSEQCVKYARRQYYLKEEKFRLKKEYLLREEKRKERELEYRLATLEYKKRKLDLLKASNKKEYDSE
ncbi:uncharacterized protein LOC129766255 [Toxorhynchites rutilus septentrionalis]|uniref:uncharacterized protein LOC129766255 n=1 Tax=Toxorhynchites rutilus septentrionalis TaxID=329112 RepID=UPI0024791E85|nr:uncharacterized protein LOC129766255 [Toxorhynchites rutilus septentrionalis]